MICKSCGRTIDNENSNFCFYCGTSLKEDRGEDFKAIQKQENQTYNISSNDTMNNKQNHSKAKVETGEGEKPLPFTNWLGSMMLPFIPVIGGIVYIIMLLYWAFSGKAPQSKKNWARATLIVLVISFVLLVAYFSMALQQLGASGFDIDSYMQQFLTSPK